MKVLDLHLNEEASLIKNSKIAIAPSTSTVHFASALGSPSITLLGAHNYYEWRTLNENSKTLFHNEVCTGCNLNDCRKKNQECMRAITEQEVINYCEKMLD